MMKSMKKVAKLAIIDPNETLLESMLLNNRRTAPTTRYSLQD